MDDEFRRRVLERVDIGPRPGDLEWSYWPVPGGGCFSAYHLRIIADELDRRNKLDCDVSDSVKNAQRDGVCRLCGEDCASRLTPDGKIDELVVDFGREFAHRTCIEREKRDIASQVSGEHDAHVWAWAVIDNEQFISEPGTDPTHVFRNYCDVQAFVASRQLDRLVIVKLGPVELQSRMADTAKALVDACRNRDRLHGELGECREELEVVIRERESLKVSVAELERGGCPVPYDPSKPFDEAVLDKFSEEGRKLWAGYREDEVAAPAAIYYRLLGKDEVPLLGDEYEDDHEIMKCHWHPVDEETIAAVLTSFRTVCGNITLRPNFRRRVPAPAVSGDAVKKSMKMPSREWFERMVSDDDSEVSVGGLASRVAYLEPWREVMQRLVDAAEGVRDWAGSPLIRVQDRYFKERDKLNAALVSAEELLSAPVTAPVASDAAVADRVALLDKLEQCGIPVSQAASEWRMLDPGEMPQIGDQYKNDGGQWCLVGARNLHLHTLPHRHKFRRRVLAPAASGAAGNSPESPVSSEPWGVVLAQFGYCLEQWESNARILGNVRAGELLKSIKLALAAPQPAPGWLTPKERTAIEWARNTAREDDGETMPHSMKLESVFSALLARQTPPEVEAACDMTPEPGDGALTRTYIEGWNSAGKLWRAFITSEGIKVKEVG